MKKISMVFMAFALLFAAVPKSNAQIGISAGVSITVAPPALPVVVQPICPGDGYIWTPGYWAYGADGYYWVDGQWVLAPEVGFLWTPPYWGFAGGFYGFHAGYWGPTIGFYGGINYGFGYTGHGYWGGRWSGGHFMYNTAVSHVNVNIIHNTYIDRSVVVNNYSHTSFNGRGGITDQPRPEEVRAASERHIAATSVQVSHETAARSNRSNFASVNHGRPAGTSVRHVNTTSTTHSTTRVSAPRSTTVSHTNVTRNTNHTSTVVNHTNVTRNTNHNATVANHTNVTRNTNRATTYNKPAARPVQHAAPAARPVQHAAPAPRQSVARTSHPRAPQRHSR